MTYPTRNFAYLLSVPVAIGLIVSLFLAVTSLTSSSVAGCGGVFDCESVIKSAWSLWFGIPVSLLAVGLYATAFGALWCTQHTSEPRRKIAWGTVVALGLSAGAAALWFIYLQVFVIQHLCLYCLIAHSCGLLIALAILVKRPVGTLSTGGLGVAALLGLGVLIAGQKLGPAPQTYSIESYTIDSLKAQPVSTSRTVAAPSNGDSQAPSQGDNSSPSDSDTFDDSIFSAPDDTIFSPPDETRKEQKTDRTLSFYSSPLRFPWVALSPALLTTGTLNAGLGDAQQDQETTEKKAADSPQATDRPQDASPTDGQANTQQGDAQQGGTQQGDAQPKEGAAQTPQEKPVRRFASLSNGRVKLEIEKWPHIGNPQAKYVFVELFDYACPHCRKTHANAIRQAETVMGDELVVLVLPLPLNTRCNPAILQTGPRFTESCEQAKLAVAIWRIDPQQFELFHEWMLTGETCPTYAAALAHAQTLVNKDELAKQLAQPVVADYIQKHVQIYQLVGKGNVPQLLFPTTVIVGEFSSPDLLCKIIRERGAVVEKK